MVNTNCPYINGMNVLAGKSPEWDCFSPIRQLLYISRDKKETPKCNCRDYSNCRWQKIEEQRNQEIRELEAFFLR